MEGVELGNVRISRGSTFTDQDSNNDSSDSNSCQDVQGDSIDGRVGVQGLVFSPRHTRSGKVVKYIGN